LLCDGRRGHYMCWGCHVAGYGEVGGSSLGHTRGLENVQCETCHGPGSIHVAEKGLEEQPAVQRQTSTSTCTGCHNEHHSDTFESVAYLRDIVRPGHGSEARNSLCDVPTGRELRGAALAKAVAAGKAVAAKKM